MISEYKKLRQRESSNKSAWRITVRQLESMIRLSEGYARMHLMDEVKAEHVQEAFRLLSKSIIRVEQPDIQFDDAIIETSGPTSGTSEAAADNLGPSEMAAQNGDAEAMDTATTTTANKAQTIKLSYDEYKRISNMLVYYIRKKEEEIETEGKKCFSHLNISYFI